MLSCRADLEGLVAKYQGLVLHEQAIVDFHLEYAGAVRQHAQIADRGHGRGGARGLATKTVAAAQPQGVAEKGVFHHVVASEQPFAAAGLIVDQRIDRGCGILAGHQEPLVGQARGHVESRIRPLSRPGRGIAVSAFGANQVQCLVQGFVAERGLHPQRRANRCVVAHHVAHVHQRAVVGVPHVASDVHDNDFEADYDCVSIKGFDYWFLLTRVTIAGPGSVEFDDERAGAGVDRMQGGL